MDWQPIASAPKDGSPILTWDGEAMFVVEWDAQSWYDADAWPRQPTHWMPLPSPPVAAGDPTPPAVPR